MEIIPIPTDTVAHLISTDTKARKRDGEDVINCLPRWVIGFRFGTYLQKIQGLPVDSAVAFYGMQCNDPCGIATNRFVGAGRIQVDGSVFPGIEDVCRTLCQVSEKLHRTLEMSGDKLSSVR